MTASESAMHLSESVRQLLDLGDEKRIEHLRAQRWIGYTKAKQVLDKMEELLSHPPTHRMPNLLVVGDTNNGKTMIVSQFQKRHPAFDNPDEDGITLPVMML